MIRAADDFDVIAANLKRIRQRTWTEPQPEQSGDAVWPAIGPCDYCQAVGQVCDGSCEGFGD